MAITVMVCMIEQVEHTNARHGHAQPETETMNREPKPGTIRRIPSGNLEIYILDREPSTETGNRNHELYYNKNTYTGKKKPYIMCAYQYKYSNIDILEIVIEK